MYPYPQAMNALPKAQKKAVIQAVTKGKPVPDASLASVAVEFASRWGRFEWWMSVGFLVLGLSSIALGVVGHHWFQLVLGLFWVGSTPFWFSQAVRAKRSIPLNQALLT
jgi:hypothetical protein